MLRTNPDVVLFGEKLERPLLKFDNVISTSVHKFPLSGIHLYGPYDKNLMPRKSVRFAIMYPMKHEPRIGDFIRSFTTGLERYPGYSRWFQQNLERFERYPISELTMEGYERAADDVLSRNYDLVFVVTEEFGCPSFMYQRIKTKLLKKGVPSQFLNSTRLYAEPHQLQWILSNISLSTYAKIGGTPWVIEASEKPEIIIGVSRVVDPKSRVIIGFAIVFKQNGDFVLSHYKSPVTTWDEYERSIEDLVYETIDKYRRIEREPRQIVFHFSKRPGHKEVESISRGIERLELDVKYALIHLNSYSGFRLFDTSHSTYVPFAGLKVRLSSHEALLLLDGRDPRGLRPFIGTPRVLDVAIDKRSTVDYTDHQRLIDQVYTFAFVNWRGFNARTTPVTTNYAYLIAKVISGLESIEEWNEIIANEDLINKAWFL
jgi:hypothetical protein